ncbi:hypothetical protein Taro_056689, partial [Colocasia esculenta]|nr:hypothetical protein [Colocasia esculenta]
LRIPFLAASGGGLVAVAVTTFSSHSFQVFLVARACTVVIARLCLVSVGVVGLALGKPVLLVVPASVFSRFRGPVLGCQPVMAPACVASRPCGVSGVWGGVLSTVSALCPTPLVSAGVVCVARPRLVVVALRWTGNPYWALFARLTPLLPSARGSSSRELGVGRVAWRRLWRRLVVSSTESERCVWFPCKVRVRVAASCSCCCAACVASVVARRVRAVAARLALDSLSCGLWSRSKCPGLVGCPLCCWGVCCRCCVFGLVYLCAVVRCARDAELSRCLACCVAPLVERCNTCMWLLSAWCWLVVSSGEAEDCSALVSAVAVLPQSLRCAVVLLAAVSSLMVRVVWSFGLCILVKVLPRIALCRFWWRFFPGVLCVRRLLALLVEILPKAASCCFGCHCSLSLYRDELSLLPVGLSVLQSAWAFSVKVLCAWPCVWLLCWPACLVV